MNARSAAWLVGISISVLAVNCVKRTRSTEIPVKKDSAAPGEKNQTPIGSGPQGSASANGGQGTTDQAKLGALNGWTGAQDQFNPVGSPWTVRSVADSNTGTTPTGTTLPPTVPGTTTPPAPAAQITYDNRVAAILTANCTGCHNPAGSQPGSPMETYDNAKARGAGIISRAQAKTMPPGGKPLAQADIDALAAWGPGFLKVATATGTPPAGTTPPATTPPGSNLTLTITDQRFGTYIHEGKITGKVGETLTVINKRTTPFQIHTNNAPFGHGNPIDPGATKTYELLTPYSGTDGVYEHTNGGVNLDRLINITVTPK